MEAEAPKQFDESQRLLCPIRKMILMTHQSLVCQSINSAGIKELAGRQYNPGKDELTITSERFKHRDENRKDCLRILFALIEEAGKVRKLVEETGTSNIKERLKANPNFMQSFQVKMAKTRESTLLPA
ncbi:uncharacterized protein LOC111393304 [Olea europaea subsp. europaea]|uniref:Uncharacterized protein LOC111393304 n=1 Tax=Olea europaea subsp. europaea TaxID=158383 RepID=A0A8S0SSX9_OLEEU|nr:uncharacterized protein LOC111393304 [Olea europaea subsp. europaea]